MQGPRVGHDGRSAYVGPSLGLLMEVPSGMLACHLWREREACDSELS
jgi:hypothetical protein